MKDIIPGKGRFHRREREGKRRAGGKGIMARFARSVMVTVAGRAKRAVGILW